MGHSINHRNDGAEHKSETEGDEDFREVQKAVGAKQLLEAFHIYLVKILITIWNREHSFHCPLCIHSRRYVIPAEAQQSICRNRPEQD